MKLEGRLICETPGVAKLGIESKAFKAIEVVQIDETWNRIQRPEPDVDHPVALIIWARTNPEDNTQSWDKVVSGCRQETSTRSLIL